MELLFHRVYEVAEIMAEVIISDYDPFGELDWDSADISACLQKFSKTSLLAYFCFSHLAIYERRMFRKDPETVKVESIQQAFQRHGIPYIPYEEFMRRNVPEGEDEQDALYPWMLDQEEAFEQLWERMTDEVFTCYLAIAVFS
jgi:hypothetical protein